MTFKTKLYLGFGILFGLFIILQVILTMMLDKLDENMDGISKNYQMVKLANTIQEELSIFSMDSRGLIANPPEKFRSELMNGKYNALKRANSAIESLRKLDREEKSQKLIKDLRMMNKTLTKMEKNPMNFLRLAIQRS
ncbi:CHASE3 domain-containing protein [Scopulibacillus daqui]|uniref:CHASE3 domain-containing protein n=1 Tax=Scopulibacillus daqui TaxID=1469162 RepID=UPI00363CDCCB